MNELLVLLGKKSLWFLLGFLRVLLESCNSKNISHRRKHGGGGEGEW